MILMSLVGDCFMTSANACSLVALIYLILQCICTIVPFIVLLAVLFHRMSSWAVIAVLAVALLAGANGASLVFPCPFLR